jgi:hypothetical protein
MLISRRVRNALFAVGFTAALAGCGGGGAAGPAIPASPNALAAAAPRSGAAELADAVGTFGAVPDASFAGTYDGTFVEKSGGVTLGGGTLVITLKTKLPAVSGTVAFTAGGQTATVPFTGTGRDGTGGTLKMNLMGATPTGCKARGPAEIVGTKFSGQFGALACNGAPAITITYTATKK